MEPAQREPASVATAQSYYRICSKSALPGAAAAWSWRVLKARPPMNGDALRISARIHWLHGDSDLAEAQSAEALEVLRDHPRTPQYAMVSSAQSQLDMLAERRNWQSPARSRLWRSPRTSTAGTSTSTH
jgi:hypothetical protein